MTGDLKRFNACWRYFNPPSRLRNATFKSYVPKTKPQHEALAACKSYNLKKLKTGEGLYLMGEYGTGKTHLAVAIVRTLMESNKDTFGARHNEDAAIYDPDFNGYLGLYCSFFPVIELLDAWRPGSESKRAWGEWLFHRAKADNLVVLDDIGAEKASEWTEDRLYAVIDARYRMEKATIFTTNCTEGDLLKNGYGRIVSRIFEMTEALKVTGPDHRRKRA